MDLSMSPHDRGQWDRIKLTRVFVRDGRGLLDEIDLKPDVVFHLVRVPRDRYHGQQVHKRLASLAIIDHADLRLLSLIDHVLDAQHRLVIDVFPFHAGLDLAIRGLQESTVSSEYFMFRVRRESFEDIGAVDDRQIMLRHVADHERARHVHRPDVDLWFRAGRHPHQHSQHVEPAGRIRIAILGDQGQVRRWFAVVTGLERHPVRRRVHIARAVWRRFGRLIEVGHAVHLIHARRIGDRHRRMREVDLQAWHRIRHRVRHLHRRHLVVVLPATVDGASTGILLRSPHRVRHGRLQGRRGDIRRKPAGRKHGHRRDVAVVVGTHPGGGVIQPHQHAPRHIIPRHVQPERFRLVERGLKGRRRDGAVVRTEILEMGVQRQRLRGIPPPQRLAVQSPLHEVPRTMHSRRRMAGVRVEGEAIQGAADARPELQHGRPPEVMFGPHRRRRIGIHLVVAPPAL